MKESCRNRSYLYAIRKTTLGVGSIVIGAFLAGGSGLAQELTVSASELESTTLVTSEATTSSVEATEAPATSLETSEAVTTVAPETTPVTEETPKTEVETTLAPQPETTSSVVSTEPVLARSASTEASSTVAPSAEEGASEETPFVKPANAVGSITGVTFDQGRALITYATGEQAQLDFYNDHVFRYYVDKTGTFIEHPTPQNPSHTAKIVIKDRTAYQENYGAVGRLREDANAYVLETEKIRLVLDKTTARMSLYDTASNSLITQEVTPIELTANKTTQTLSQAADEYFFGGGMQNGRFSHKGNKINIVNENNWVDGGVASPSPFYWSTKGYGVLRNTFKPGQYDFGTENKAQLTSSHNEERFDAYYFVNTNPINILKDYYELTGTPAVLPEYALYMGHLNAYNRDYWVEVAQGTPGAIELDGKYYREYQPSNLADKSNATLETLNGEGDSYKFSARAVIDRYKNKNMPLSWFLPNDGYGAGYGQTDSLAGDIENLKRFVEYAKENGIKVGLWTQSALHPQDPNNPRKGERDIINEVAKAGVRAIKTDVAWVGPGYSFGLSGVEDTAKQIENNSPEHARPFIVSLDGWGGTQRHAAIWSGDQTGGEWEYIRFHIPTYIGMGLSGNPNMGSDMDGIFGGSDPIINAREYQWKVYTSILMNMDGWGSKPKTPFAFDDKITDLNRISLKQKSTLVPYAYSIGHEASQSGKPIVRAMFLEFPDEVINYTKDVQYQYMYGDSFLVAPVYKNTAMQANGDDVRNGIYLPDSNTEWIDYYTGQKYQGGQMLNGYAAPLWKLPVFVRNGAIVPLVNANNNPGEIDRNNRVLTFYPHGDTSFKLYEDDGTTTDYKSGRLATTLIRSQAGNSNEPGRAVLTVNRTSGDYEGMVRNRTTEFHVNASQDVTGVTATVNGQSVTLTRVNSLEEYKAGTNVYFYHNDPLMETYNPTSTEVQNLRVTMNDLLKVKLAAVDITASDLVVTIDGFVNKNEEVTVPEGMTVPTVPTNVAAPEQDVTSTTIRLTWDRVEGATSYDVQRDGTVFTGITDPSFIFDGFDHGSEHRFAVRAVNAKGQSAWSDVLVTSTSQDPWLHAIEGITATATSPEQPSEPLGNLFNKNLGDLYHSKWGQAVNYPMTINMDLGGVYQVDYLEYHPRAVGSNGRITKVYFSTSEDNVNWTTDTNYSIWGNDTKAKQYRFNAPKARYIKMIVDGAVGNFVSGRELLVFKKPGTRMEIPGDINRDGRISEDDKTSFLNYSGLRSQDNDFDYIKHVDANRNGLIDAEDISVIATQLEGGVTTPSAQAPSGRVYLEADKLALKAGETTVVRLIADDLAAVNALTSTFTIDSRLFEVVNNDIRSTDFIKQADNFSRIRTRQNDTNVVFSFINFGQKELLSGSGKVAEITLRALQDSILRTHTADGILVGNDLRKQSSPNLPIRAAVDYTATPTVPANLSLVKTTHASATLTWDKNTDTLWYLVEQEVGTGADARFEEVGRTEGNHFNVYNLTPETAYRFRLRALNPTGQSEPTTALEVTTSAKDLTGRLSNLTATATSPEQPGQNLTLFFDGNEDTQYHSKWHNNKAVPSSLTIDLGDAKNVDYLTYVPRRDAGNGTITSLTIETSQDGENWTPTNELVKWLPNRNDKVVELPEGTVARYVRLNWLTSVGGYVSGQELHVIEDQTPQAPVNKADLVSEVEAVSLLDLDQYTSETVTPLLAEITEALAIIGDDLASQTEVDAALNLLQELRQGLEEKLRTDKGQGLTAEELPTYDLTADNDGDGVSNLVELQSDTDPEDAESYPKSKGEGLTTEDLPTYDLTADNDGDGVSNLVELQSNTDPEDAESYPKSKGEGLTTEELPTYDLTADNDGDGVSNLVELQSDTDPEDADSYPKSKGEGLTTEDLPTYDLSQILQSPKELQDDPSGVRVVLGTGESAAAVGLAVTHIEAEAATTPAALTDTDYDLFDIEVVDKDGNPVDIMVPAVVTLPVDPGKDVDRVVYLPDGGTAEEVTFVISDDKSVVTFEASHFSHYGIIYHQTAKGTSTTAEALPTGDVSAKIVAPVYTPDKPTYSLEELLGAPVQPEPGLKSEKPVSAGTSTPLSTAGQKVESYSRSARHLPNTGDRANQAGLLGSLSLLAGLGLVGAKRRGKHLR